MTHMAPALRTSASDRWFTPPDLLMEVAKFLGDFHDPCPARLSGERIDSGLWQSWADRRVYLNPPYGRAINAWIRKAMTESVDELLLLIPARTDTTWFQPLYEHSICFLRGRLRFSNASHSAPFPSALVYRGARPQAFTAAFRHRGVVVQRITERSAAPAPSLCAS